MELFDSYLKVGGYPEAVKAYASGDSHADVTQEIMALLEEDFANSREMDKGELSRKPFLFQLACQASRLMAPIQ